MSQEVPGASENLPTQNTRHPVSSKVPIIPERQEAITKSQDDTSDRGDGRWEVQNNKQKQFRQKKFVSAISSPTGQ